MTRDDGEVNGVGILKQTGPETQQYSLRHAVQRETQQYSVWNILGTYNII